MIDLFDQKKKMAILSFIFFFVGEKANKYNRNLQNPEMYLSNMRKNIMDQLSSTKIMDQ